MVKVVAFFWGMGTHPTFNDGILISWVYKPLRTWVDEFIPYSMEISWEFRLDPIAHMERIDTNHHRTREWRSPPIFSPRCIYIPKQKDQLSSSSSRSLFHNTETETYTRSTSSYQINVFFTLYNNTVEPLAKLTDSIKKERTPPPKKKWSTNQPNIFLFLEAFACQFPSMDIAFITAIIKARLASCRNGCNGSWWTSEKVVFQGLPCHHMKQP